MQTTLAKVLTEQTKFNNGNLVITGKPTVNLDQTIHSTSRKRAEDIGHDRSIAYSAADERTWVSRIPPFFKEATLETCPDLPRKLVDFGYEWAKPHDLKSLFLYGEWGSGKTWYAFSLIRELMRTRAKRGYFWPRYVTGKELDANLLQAIRHQDGDLETIKQWAEHDLLFVDEVDKISRDDSGKASNRFKLQLFEIVNRRMLVGKPTILTSNYSTAELGDVIDGSLVSRMSDQ